MRQQVLAQFPAQVYPLTLVSDPDNILGDETLAAELVARGFRIIAETDPVALRHRYVQAAPITAESPVVVVTPGLLKCLPYDLWEQGHHITLALHTFFPDLDYPTLQELSTGQRARLAAAREGSGRPAASLSPSQTADYLLRTVFDAAPETLRSPAALVLWLDAYHAGRDPMPPNLAARLLVHLGKVPALAGLPTAGLVSSADAYVEFVRSAWRGSLSHLTGETLPEYETGRPRVTPGNHGGTEPAPAPTEYGEAERVVSGGQGGTAPTERAEVERPAPGGEGETKRALRFETDPELQDALPRLVRSGAVLPLEVEKVAVLPAWARPAVDAGAQRVLERRTAEGLQQIRDELAGPEPRWEGWQGIARRWAQLLVWRSRLETPPSGDLAALLAECESRLDSQFLAWLQAHYTPLAVRPLPRPKHLYHVPTWLAHHYVSRGRRVALLVLDGLSIGGWLLIRDAWRDRHEDWQFDEMAALAQGPSLTCVSRQALIGGLRPAAFEESLTVTSREEQRWKAFWQEQGLAPEAAVYASLPAGAEDRYPAGIDSIYTQALCLVLSTVDDMVHGATQGTGEVLASLQLWLRDSRRLETIVQRLLRNGCAVVLTADHGHVEATGMGQPREGVTVESRSKRARLYNNADFARAVHEEYPQTVLWHGDDALLPACWWALMPKGRQAFAPEGARVVSHGGLTIEEMIVPLVVVSEKSY